MHDQPPAGLIGWIILAGAVAAALYGIWRYVVRPIARAITLVVQVGGDFLGHDARPGVARVPGVMERLADIDKQIKVNGTGLPLGDAVAAALKEARSNAAGITELKNGQGEARAAAERAAELAEEVHDELHEWVAEGQLREETYRETLREVHGIDLDPPPRRDPHARTREDD